MPVGRQLMEVPIVHQGASQAEARQRALTMLAEVNLPDPESVIRPLSPSAVRRSAAARRHRHGADGRAFAPGHGRADHRPRRHRRGGGARPRRAAAPKLGTAIVFISHNLGTVVRVCDRIGVMYAGELVEEGTSARSSATPAIPTPAGCSTASRCSARTSTRGRSGRSRGQVPPALARPKGCVFAARCGYRRGRRCTTERIPMRALEGEPDHCAQCVRAEEIDGLARAGGERCRVRRGTGARSRCSTSAICARSISSRAGIFSREPGYDVKALNDITSTRAAAA